MTFPTTGAYFRDTFLKSLDATQVALNLVASTHKVALWTNTLTTPAPDTDTGYAVAPWNANEITGTGYTAGGALLASPTLVGSAGGIGTWDATDTAWTTATFSAVRGAMVYADALTPKYGLLIVPFGADFAVTAGTFTIQWAVAGLGTQDWIP